MKKAASLLLYLVLIASCDIHAQWVETIFPYIDYSCQFATVDTNLFVMANDGMYLSTNNGNNWKKINNGLDITAYICLKAYSDGAGITNLFIGTYEGVYQSSNNGASWTSINSMLSNTMVQSLIEIPDGTGSKKLLLGNWFKGVTVLSYTGTYWRLMPEILPDNRVSGFIFQDSIVFAVSDSGIIRSKDNGNNWAIVNNGFKYNYINAFFSCPDNTNRKILFAESSDGLYKSTNEGTSWNKVNEFPVDFNIQSVALIPNESGGTKIFASIENKGVYISSDYCKSWTYVGDGFDSNADIRAIAVCGKSLFASVFGYGVWRRPLSEMVDNVLPVDMITFKGNCLNNEVILKWSTATETNNKGFEIERMENDGTWRDIGFVAGKGTSTIINYYNYSDNNITISGKYSYRIKQIDYNGTYKYSEIINVAINGLPNKYSLDQNYPNPFNPETIINYQLPKDGFVTLKLYNVLGKEVKTLLNEFKNQGRYTLKFDGSALPSGVYFYKMDVNDYTTIKKMILTK